MSSLGSATPLPLISHVISSFQQITYKVTRKQANILDVAGVEILEDSVAIKNLPQEKVYLTSN